MDLKDLFNRSLNQASEVVHKVKPEQFTYPTPDTEWDVKKLASHMLYELSWAPDILNGKTIEEVGDRYDGDLIGNSLQEKWDAALARAKNAINKVDLDQTIHLSYGKFPARHYVQQLSNDLFIHAWDLAKGIGYDINLDPEISEFLYKASLPRKTQLASTGLFAPAVDVPESSDIQTKLLALFGRES